MTSRPPLPPAVRRHPNHTPGGTGIRPRPAYTLVECLVMMTLIGTTLGAISTTLHGLYRIDGRLRAELDDERRFDQFLERWRDDAHAATGVTAPESLPPARHVALTTAERRTIEYSIDDSQITRVVRTGGEIRHWDAFDLSGATRARWRLETDQARPVIWLEFSSGDDPRPSRPVKRAAAVVGLEPPRH
jgi:type II secretory pathway pseudopilin PulG